MSPSWHTSLRCTGCGSLWLSPAGNAVVVKGERCLHCESELTVADQVDGSDGTDRQAWNRWLAGDIDGLTERRRPEAEDIH